MLTIIQLSFRNVLRNSRRSMLTAATVMLGCALLTIGLSWVQGIHGNFIDASVQANGHVRMVSEGFAARERLMRIARRARLGGSRRGRPARRSGAVAVCAALAA